MKRRLSRRRFVARTAVAAGAVAAGLHLPAMVSAAAEGWGDLTGRFLYDGTPPERRKLTVDKDIECCGKFDIRDESLMVGPDGGLANVFVYVRSRGVEICPELEASVEKDVLLDNRDCIFIPHCMTIWYEKQQYYVVNSDPVAQNVAFTPLGDVPVNKIIPVGGEFRHQFGRKQTLPVKVACNYHPWESAYVLPLDHPYAAVSAADGTFTIPKLPAGDLEFQVWHEKIGYLDTPQWTGGRFEMTIQPGTNDLGTVKIDPAWLVES